VTLVTNKMKLLKLLTSLIFGMKSSKHPIKTSVPPPNSAVSLSTQNLPAGTRYQSKTSELVHATSPLLNILKLQKIYVLVFIDFNHVNSSLFSFLLEVEILDKSHNGTLFRPGWISDEKLNFAGI
jgi:hypothetical protein